MRSSLLAALLLVNAQDDGARGVIDRVDAALGEFRDASLTVRGTSRAAWFPMTVEGGVHLRIRRTGEAVLSATFLDREIVGGRVSYRAIMGADQAVFEVRPWLTESPAAPLHLRARLPMTPAAFADADLLILPTSYPVRLFLDEPLLYYALAPKRYFALVPDLKLVATEPNIVLHSRVLIKEPIKALGLPLVQSAQYDRRFVIDPKTHRLERVTVRIDIARGTVGHIASSRVIERDARGLPTKIEVRETGVQQGSMWDRSPYVRVVTYDAVDRGVDVPVIDASLPCSDAVLKSPSIYAKAVEARPDDADAHASLAAARIWPKRVAASMIDSSKKASSDEKSLEPLAAVARLRPKDAAAVLNLLAVETEAAKRAALFADAAGEVAVVRAADALMSGDAAAALAALPAGDLPAHAVPAAGRIRIAALVRAGRAVEAFPLIADAESLSQLSGKDALALEEALAKADAPPAQALLGAAWHSRTEPERATKMLAKLLSLGGLPEDVRSQAAHLALACKAVSLAPQLDGTPHGALLAGDPARALRLMKERPRPEYADVAAATSVALSKREDHALTIAAVELALSMEDSPEQITFNPGEESAYTALASVFLARKKVEEVARLLGPRETARSWMLYSAFEKTGQTQDFCAAAVKWAQENPKSAKEVVWLARIAGDLLYNRAQAIAVLGAATGAGADDPLLLLEAALVSDDRRAADLYAKVLAQAPAGRKVAHVQRAVQAALRAGMAERAREFATHAPTTVEEPEAALRLAEVLSEAGDADRARQVARSLEDAGRRPFVLFGRIAESRKEYESAARWYNRDIREGGDALELDDWDQQTFRRRKISAGEAKKDLMKRIGEDYFVDRMLAAPAEPLGGADARDVKRLFEQLTSEEIGARDEAEAGLTQFGRRAVAIVKAGLESADEDVRSRVRALLRKWADPQ